MTGTILVVGNRTAPAWPSSIAPIAGFVSKDRHLDFSHPVPVHFVAPKTFDAQIAQQDKPANASQRAEYARTAAEYRALGLLGGAVNLEAAQSSLDAGSVLAYYDDQRKDIVVRGTRLDPATRVTLAHELTHTLQDQHFNLTRLDNEANNADNSFALTALVEGDAVVTEGDYAASLPPREQQEANDEMDASSGSSTSGTPAASGATNNSSYLDISSGVPYVLGPDFDLVLYYDGGVRAVNNAFTHPPATQLDILNPAAYLLGTRTHQLAAPTVPRGTKRQGSSDSFGAFDTYMVLAGYMDARTALLAADGWGGGSYVQYRQGSASCTKVDIEGSSATSGQFLLASFQDWARALPLHQASVRAVGSTVQVTACDPGKMATVGTQSRDRALTIADERNGNIGDALLDGVSSPTVALCVGDQAIGDRSLLQAENALNSSYSSPSASVQSTIQTETGRLVRLCQGPHPPPAA